MKGEERRTGIIKRLTDSTLPISASSLAKELGVSRQVIVQDIALLRANGTEISSFARGYMLNKKRVCTRVFKVIHSDDEVEKELTLIVDAGGTIENVFVYHKVYGMVKAPMSIRSRLDVQNFLEGINSGKSSLLKNVTSGYHYHTISADCEKTLELIAQKLKENGFLAPLQEYEPSELKNN